MLMLFVLIAVLAAAGAYFMPWLFIGYWYWFAGVAVVVFLPYEIWAIRLLLQGGLWELTKRWWKALVSSVIDPL